MFEKVRKGGYHLSALCASGDEYDDDFSPNGPHFVAGSN